MTEPKNMTFDEAYAALEQTVTALESPDVQFEESMKLYERACELVICCRRMLADAKTKMTDINARINQLSETEMPFLDEED